MTNEDQTKCLDCGEGIFSDLSHAGRCLAENRVARREAELTAENAKLRAALEIAKHIITEMNPWVYDWTSSVGDKETQEELLKLCEEADIFLSAIAELEKGEK